MDDEERRQRSDAARLAAMRERVDRQREKERQIAADIANVDKKGTKRMVFEDSDEEEEDGGSSDKEEVEEVEVVKEKKTPAPSSAKKPKLFDESDDDKDDNEDEEEIVIKNRHTGPKGEKLMQLEAKFQSDPRFKLDDKFAESSDSEAEIEQDSEKIEMKQEKEKHRELLSKILGKTVVEEKKNKVDVMTRPFTRFDPENPEHVEWMKAFEETKQKKTKKVEEEEVEKDVEKDEEEDDEGGKSGNSDVEFEKSEIFYQLDDKFSSELKEKSESSGGGFSFLASIGRKYDDDGPKVNDKPKEILKLPAKIDENGEKMGLKGAVKMGKFFITENDQQVRSMATNFRRTQSLEKIIDAWTPHRDAIFKLWKKQRREAVKRQKNGFATNGKANKMKRKHDEMDKPSEL